MKYTNARDVLPQELLEALRKYVPEGLLYIASDVQKRRRWGSRTGAREALDMRNHAIRKRFCAGEGVDALAQAYCLSIETIRKIIYSK